MPTVCQDNVVQNITFSEQREFCKKIDCPISLRSICTGQLIREKSIRCKLLLDFVLLKRGMIKP